jgi:hypothetical protein
MPTKAFCKRRNDLAELLVDLSIKLSIAAVEMTSIVQLNNSPAFAKVKLEIERLRDECENVKSELVHHRLKHGC